MLIGIVARSVCLSISAWQMASVAARSAACCSRDEREGSQRWNERREKAANLSSRLDEPMLVSEVHVSWVLFSRVDPAVSDGDSSKREVGKVRGVEKCVG